MKIGNRYVEAVVFTDKDGNLLGMVSDTEVVEEADYLVTFLPYSLEEQGN